MARVLLWAIGITDSSKRFSITLRRIKISANLRAYLEKNIWRTSYSTSLVFHFLAENWDKNHCSSKVLGGITGQMAN